MGLISLDTSQPQVAISGPEISFPMSPARSLPVSHDPSDRMPRQIARKTMPLSQITARKLDSYNVKLNDEEKSDCLITGIAITNDGRRLLADSNNDKIKMFSRDMSSLHSLSLSSRPWDIAVTGDREPVVSFNETKLLLLEIPLVRRGKWYLDMVKVCLMFVPNLAFIPPSDPNRTMNAR